MEIEWTAKECSEIYHHTVPIFNYDHGQPSLVGTGIFTLAKGHHFVGTAAHVFEHPFQKVAFGTLHRGRGFEVFGADNMPILTAQAVSGAGDTRSAVYKDGLDLAIIKPTADVLKQLLLHYKPYTLLHEATVSLPAWGIASGWPARKNEFNRRQQRCDFETCYHMQWRIAEPDEVAKAGWNADVYFALQGDKAKDFASLATGERIHLPNFGRGQRWWSLGQIGSERIMDPRGHCY
jgi:hypothetical protein